jgi:hypothetical protein
MTDRVLSVFREIFGVFMRDFFVMMSCSVIYTQNPFAVNLTIVGVKIRHDYI